eukprot:COSAG01_NODE_3454_length_6075_cov_5.552878_7_plen_49_part_00
MGARVSSEAYLAKRKKEKEAAEAKAQAEAASKPPPPVRTCAWEEEVSD